MFKNRIVYLIVVIALLITAGFVVQSAIATGQTESTSRKARAVEAETARWVAMGEYYTDLQQSAANAQRGREADAARWVAMGKYYTGLQAAEAARQTHRDLIAAARYTGLALEDYELTGKKSSLPACIAAEIAAELPANIGSNGWKALVPACSQ